MRRTETLLTMSALLLGACTTVSEHDPASSEGVPGATATEAATQAGAEPTSDTDPAADRPELMPGSSLTEIARPPLWFERLDVDR